MVLGGLAILALATSGKKASAAPADGGLTPQLPPGPGSSASDGRGGIVPGTKTNTRPIGPLPVVLPEDLAEMVAKSLRDLTVNDDGSISGPVTAEAVQRATTVAAQVENAGFPDAARAFRAFIQAAAKKVPSPPKDKQVQVPGLPQDMVDQINRAIQLERDPKKLQAILDALRSQPASAQRDLLIQMLEQTIQQVQAALVLADTLKKTDQVLKSPGLPPVTTTPAPIIDVPPMVITAPSPTPSLPASPASEIPDTPEARRAVNTSNMLRNRIVDAGGDVKKAKGKEDKSLVMAFQKAEGLAADGKSGPGTTLKLAKYTGDIPLVYYWPTAANAKSVLNYRTTLLQMADVHEQNGRPNTAAKLRAAAAKERGQAGIVGTMPA